MWCHVICTASHQDSRGRVHCLSASLPHAAPMKSCIVSQPYIRLCCTFWFIETDLIHITDRQEWYVLCVLCTASNQLHCCYTHTSITVTINALFTVNEKYIYIYNRTATKLMWYHILFHGIIIQNRRCNTWNIWSLWDRYSVLYI
jgi:hypothetical protein